MWNYERRLEFPVNIKEPNADIAQAIISQYGGPDGEMGASVPAVCLPLQGGGRGTDGHRCICHTIAYQSVPYLQSLLHSSHFSRRF